MTQHIVTHYRPPVGHIVLHRPQALNSLSLDMILGIHAALDQWRDDPNIVAVIISGSGDRAFCAGGDVRSLYAHRHDLNFGYKIFRAEYTLNLKIAEYPKPFIALMHGITMGGGVGISVYGSHRVMTDSSKFSMPECALGLFPDIGAAWFLQHAPGKLGLYLGLSGEIMNAAECLYSGMATHYATPENFARIADRMQTIQSAADVETVLSALSSKPEMPAMVALNQNRIDDHFADDHMIRILQRLAHDDWGREVLRILEKNSPTSLALTLQSFVRARGRTLPQILTTDMLLAQHCIRRPELYEGIRAALIDKDRTPRWNPPTIQQVNGADIDAYFESIEGLDCMISSS